MSAGVQPISYRPQCAKLLRWWDRHGRKDLPWQLKRGPYTALVAELMLQQTTVATALRYFPGFIRRFPTARALARASQDEVLRQWQGLGYYARARNLRKACQQITARASRWPSDADGWQALPGVGRSTANAIVASLSDRPQAVLDGNVKRVLARLFAVDAPIGQPGTMSRLWELAEDFLPARRGRDFAQAMMDLGALVCTRSRPQCSRCPLRADCKAYQGNLAGQIPRRLPAAAKASKEFWLLCIRRRNGSYLFGARPASGIWGGLWTPPMPESSVPLSGLGHWLRGTLGIDGTPQALGEPIRHELTHISLRLHPVEVAPGPLAGRKRLPARIIDSQSGIAYGWHRPDEIPGGLPISVHRLTQLIKDDRGAVFGQACR